MKDLAMINLVVAIGLPLLLVASCDHEPASARSRIDTSGAPEVMECKDTRDGETFVVMPKTARNVTGGIFSDVCVTVDVLHQDAREICKSHEAWLKCKPIKTVEVQ